MDEKMEEMIDDITDDGDSVCCGAVIRMGFCSDCHEHCE